MFRHLLLAAKRYGIRSLSAICERVLSECIDVETAAATLAMAHRQGFEKLKEACFEFMMDPCIFELVQETKGYFKLECWETSLVEDLWGKYCGRRDIGIFEDLLTA
ncbi:hypothetical protein BAE44_0002917 [Dichanthelium oligosanthes]|uniref:BPM/SPOP BACK domain-containing protein n=1 Tax=Dichanthelium oligosanthes TaxID=888268 RepID=A0A1E5WFC5_9POAL|nr:hypothetical protein BAE44_0002917 [Dichanthelium oligosanthes]